MKTIAVSIDEGTLEAIDRVARSGPGRRGGNRSAVVREALSEYVLARQRRGREERDREALGGQRERLRKQAAALVAEQAKL